MLCRAGRLSAVGGQRGGSEVVEGEVDWAKAEAGVFSADLEKIPDLGLNFANLLVRVGWAGLIAGRLDSILIVDSARCVVGKLTEATLEKSKSVAGFQVRVVTSNCPNSSARDEQSRC